MRWSLQNHCQQNIVECSKAKLDEGKPSGEDYYWTGLDNDGWFE